MPYLRPGHSTTRHCKSEHIRAVTVPVRDARQVLQLIWYNIAHATSLRRTGLVRYQMHGSKTTSYLSQTGVTRFLAPEQGNTGIAVEAIAAHNKARRVIEAVRKRHVDVVVVLLQPDELVTPDNAHAGLLRHGDESTVELRAHDAEESKTHLRGQCRDVERSQETLITGDNRRVCELLLDDAVDLVEQARNEVQYAQAIRLYAA